MPRTRGTIDMWTRPQIPSKRDVLRRQFIQNVLSYSVRGSRECVGKALADQLVRLGGECKCATLTTICMQRGSE